jgi:S1-C subfamily serine protease
MEKKSSMITVLLLLSSLFSSVLLVKHSQEIHEQERVVANAAESVVSLEDAGGRGRGTGFIVETESGKRVIMTNAHVCEMNPIAPIFVVYHRTETSLRAELKFKATVIKKDEKHDLCMVSVPPDFHAKPLKLADNIKIDSKVYILGYPIIALLSTSTGYIRGYELVDAPYDLPLEMCRGVKHYLETVSIKQKDGKIVIKQQCFLRAKFIFTDALGDHGASGGPGLNGDGEVVGVMSMITGQARPFAMLVPLESLREFLSTY